jgi:hypothetical protein
MVDLKIGSLIIIYPGDQRLPRQWGSLALSEWIGRSLKAYGVMRMDGIKESN